MSTLRAALHLAAKDLRLYARDKGGLALGFLLPIALISVMAAVFGGMGNDDGGAMPKPKLRVLDLDGTPASAAVVAALKKQEVARVVDWEAGKAPADRDAVVRRVAAGDDPLVFVVGRGFEADLAAGREPSIELVRELSRTVEARIVEQALMGALMDSQGGKIGRLMTSRGVDALADSMRLPPMAKTALDGMAKGFFDRLDREAAAADSRSPADAAASKPAAANPFGGMEGMGAAFGLKTTTVGGESAGGTKSERIKVAMIAQSVAGTAVMMLLFGLVACGTTLLQEKEEGTLRRLLAGPTPPDAIVLGKFVFSMVVGVAQLLVMFAFGRLAFGLPVERHLFATIVFIVATAAAATGLGSLLAVVGRTRKQIEGLSTLIILVMSAIGGSWFPIFIMPEWMQNLAGCTVTGWAMKGFQGVYYYGKSLADLWKELALLFGFAAALLAASLAVFRKRFA
jgi:ABC-2 type transport system permease protein